MDFNLPPNATPRSKSDLQLIIENGFIVKHDTLEDREIHKLQHADYICDTWYVTPILAVSQYEKEGEK